uniref:Uncharacterized protein n=1 Tax=Podoviridae sp. ctoqT5 TaxID=2826577 RepID=A0A8S5MPQ9_9CAUD|nr:MAG TPA: hypothetical protein [Podoviridae sp. ctoqT5]
MFNVYSVGIVSPVCVVSVTCPALRSGVVYGSRHSPDRHR